MIHLENSFGYTFKKIEVKLLLLQVFRKIRGLKENKKPETALFVTSTNLRAKNSNNNQTLR